MASSDEMARWSVPAGPKNGPWPLGVVSSNCVGERAVAGLAGGHFQVRGALGPCRRMQPIGDALVSLASSARAGSSRRRQRAKKSANIRRNEEFGVFKEIVKTPDAGRVAGKVGQMVWVGLRPVPALAVGPGDRIEERSDNRLMGLAGVDCPVRVLPRIAEEAGEGIVVRPKWPVRTRSLKKLSGQARNIPGLTAPDRAACQPTTDQRELGRVEAIAKSDRQWGQDRPEALGPSVFVVCELAT